MMNCSLIMNQSRLSYTNAFNLFVYYDVINRIFNNKYRKYKNARWLLLHAKMNLNNDVSRIIKERVAIFMSFDICFDRIFLVCKFMITSNVQGKLNTFGNYILLII